MEQFGDVVISDAQASRKEQTANAYANASECGPPHPVDGQRLEEVLEGIHHAAHACRYEADYSTQEQGTNCKWNSIHVGDSRCAKERARTEDISSQNGRSRTGDRNWNQASRSQFEEQEFNSEKDRSNRSRKGS